MGKHVFYKTVRSNGASVWAPPPLGRIYAIGGHYEFPAYAPAHVFARKGVLRSYAVELWGLDELYCGRSESDGGNRVLICFGELKLQVVPILDICFDDNPDVGKLVVFTSTSFDVIGEVFPPIKCERETARRQPWLSASQVGRILELLQQNH